jgi:hypothetical protein
MLKEKWKVTWKCPKVITPGQKILKAYWKAADKCPNKIDTRGQCFHWLAVMKNLGNEGISQ